MSKNSIEIKAFIEGVEYPSSRIIFESGSLYLIGEENKDEATLVTSDNVELSMKLGVQDNEGTELWSGDVVGKCIDKHEGDCVLEYMSGTLMLINIKTRAYRPCNISSGLKGFSWVPLEKNPAFIKKGNIFSTGGESNAA